MNFLCNIFGGALKGVLGNVASIFAIIQAVVKALKELSTAVINILFIFQGIIPAEKIQKLVDVIRSGLNKVDEFIQKIKDFFLKIGITV